MNKIKIINTSALRELRNCKDQLKTDLKERPKKHRTLDQYFQGTSNFFQADSLRHRPLTPSDVIKDLYQKQSIRKLSSSQRHIKIQRKNRIKTASTHPPVSFQERQRFSAKKKSMQTQTYNSKISAYKNAYQQRKNSHVIDNSEEIKSEIDKIFQNISAQNQLTRLRMSKKITEYKQNRFVKFWRIHNLKPEIIKHKRTMEVENQQRKRLKTQKAEENREDSIIYNNYIS